MTSSKLPLGFYTRENVAEIAKDLLGKTIHTHINGLITVGKITETEAYCGATDKASHAYQQKRTKRTEVMFWEGGIAYIYLCYGIHNMFNIVTNQKDKADAVLIRAIEPIKGSEYMLQRRKMDRLERRLSAGPGLITIALGINKNHNAASLLGDEIWLEDAENIGAENIIESPRIGVAYAGQDALLPWRFRIKNSLWTSKAEANYLVTNII